MKKFNEFLEEAVSASHKKAHKEILDHVKSAGYEVVHEHEAAKDKNGSFDHRVWLKHKDNKPHDKAAMREHIHDKFQAFGGDDESGGYNLRGQHGPTKFSLGSLSKGHESGGHVMLTTYPAKKPGR